VQLIRCDIARIIWKQSNCWPLNINAFEKLPVAAWIKSIINPSEFLVVPEKNLRFQLFAAITMDFFDE
jgi:hypothetical protein